MSSNTGGAAGSDDLPERLVPSVEEEPNRVIRAALAAGEKYSDPVAAAMYTLRSTLNRITLEVARLRGFDFASWATGPDLPRDLDFDHLGSGVPTYFDRAPRGMGGGRLVRWEQLAGEHRELWEAASAFREAFALTMLELAVAGDDEEPL